MRKCIKCNVIVQQWKWLCNKCSKEYIESKFTSKKFEEMKMLKR